MKRIFRSGNSVRSNCRGSQCFLSRDIARASHHHIGFLPLVVTRLAPDTNALRAVCDGSVHIHVLKVELLVADDHVDIVLATQTMVDYRQQTIDIRRHVYPSHLSPFVDDHINEAGILVSEAVVILPPNSGGNQQVERRDTLTPGQLVADRQPLGVLVEHRIDDMRECFVSRKEAVPAGQDIALRTCLPTCVH